MPLSRPKQQKPSKRTKTQPTGYSAFDDSIILLILSQIQKCLHDIAKSKFQSLPLSLSHIAKDLHILSSDCKHKEKLNLLIVHLHVFELLEKKKYQEALPIIHSKSSHFSDKTHKILKLSVQLLQALVLKYLERQEESKDMISETIQLLDLAQLKIKAKSVDQKIIEAAILCVSITAEHFGKFQSQSFGFREIYTEAYRIAYKYLTQYHKLTQTLFTICRNFPHEETDNIRKSKRKSFKTVVKKRHSLNPNSNRYFAKDAKSDRSYLNYTIQPKSMSTLNDSSEFGGSIRHTQIPKRLRTIEPCIDLREQKELCLSKLYGTELKELKEKVNLNKKYLKKAKLSSSLKPSYQPQYAVEMKQLQKISKLYLPKLDVKRRDLDNNKKEKLNAVDVLKFGSTLSRLKPNYFDRIKTQQDDRVCHSQAKDIVNSRNDTKNSTSIKRFSQNQPNLQRPVSPAQVQFQNIHIQNDLKEKLITSLKQQSYDRPGPHNSQQSCQLI